MNSSKDTSSRGGISLVGALGLLFVALKLTGYIDWSWWWVLAPFWGVLVFLVVFAVIVLVAALIDAANK